MKKVVLALAIAVATAAAAQAQTAKPATKPAASKPDAQAKPAAHAAKPMMMKGEVVSTDAAAKTVTVKDSAGSNTTLTATGSAVASLASLKPGDEVTITHNDMNATKIVKAKKAKASASAKPKK